MCNLFHHSCFSLWLSFTQFSLEEEWRESKGITTKSPSFHLLLPLNHLILISWKAKSINHFRIYLPFWLLFSSCKVMREKGERVRVLREGRKEDREITHVLRSQANDLWAFLKISLWAKILHRALKYIMDSIKIWKFSGNWQFSG